MASTIYEYVICIICKAIFETNGLTDTETDSILHQPVLVNNI